MVVSTGLGAVCPRPHKEPILHRLANLFKPLDVTFLPVTLGNVLQDLVHAWRTLTAGGRISRRIQNW